MKKLSLFVLIITMLMIPGINFSQEVITDTLATDVSDTLQQQLPDTLQQKVPDTMIEKKSDDKPKKKAKSSGIHQGWGISLKAGTLGIGMEVIRRQNQFLTIRVGGSYFPYKYGKSDTEFEVEKTYRADLGGVTLIADWFVMGSLSGFHLSGGLAYNMTNLTVTGVPINTYTIGTYTIPPEQLGDLEIKVEPNKFSPYLGLGFGSLISSTSRLTFNFQLGILYNAKPKIEFVATGMIQPTAEQIGIVEQNVEGFIFYPVIDFQIAYRLNRIK